MKPHVKQMREYRLEGSYRTLLNMLSNDLQEHRAKNDMAEGNQMYRNQGVCRYLKSLLKELGFDPDKEKPKVYDGAFN